MYLKSKIERAQMSLINFRNYKMKIIPSVTKSYHEVYFLFIILLLAHLIFASTAFADSSTSTNSINKSTSNTNVMTTNSLPSVKTKSNFSNSFSIQRTNNLFVIKGEKQNSLWEMANNLTYSWNENFKTDFLVEYSYDLVNSDESDWGRVRLLNTKIFSFFPIGVSFSLLVPSQKSDFINQKNFSAGLSTKINPFGHYLDTTGLTPKLTTGVSKNFYKYDTSPSGTSLIATSWSKGLELTYKPNSKILNNFNFAFIYTHFSSWNFNGEIKEAYAHNEEISYDQSENLSIKAGHTWGLPSSSPFKDYNNKDYAQTWDEKNSTVYIGLDWNL